MTTAERVRTPDTRPARWSRAAALAGSLLLLALLITSRRTDVLAGPEAAAWSLVLALLALRFAGGSAPSLDGRLGVLLPMSLVLSTLHALVRLGAPDGGRNVVALQHLPVAAHVPAVWSTLRAMGVGLVTVVLAGARPGGAHRSAALVLVGMASTLTAADLAGLDLATAPMAGLSWLLAAWACLVAVERISAAPALEVLWRRMHAFAVLLLGGVELAAVGLRPSPEAMLLLTVRYGPWLALCAGSRPLLRRLALGWSALMGLDLVHRTLAPAFEWALADLGAVALAGLMAIALVRSSPRMAVAPAVAG